MTAAAKIARIPERARAPQVKKRLPAVKRKVPDVNPAQLSRAVQALNRADKHDDWFEFLRHVE